ncbi:MAG: type VI secretion system baseplate subunit TssF [Chitinivibrionales bacterium]
MIEKYYEEELRYLYESGKEFAKAYPDRARFLNIDAVGDRDPYVERLFEGFAFLAARIREKIDDSFPELTESLINLMWPNFLKEIPAVAIVQFAPRAGLLQEARVLPRGSELLSNPVGPEHAICRFTTTADVRLAPVTLDSIEKSVDTKGKASLVFHFRLGPGVKWKNLSLGPLRLYLHAELPTALMLHEYLTTRVQSCKISFGAAGNSFEVAPDGAVTPSGLSSGESLLPQDSRSFRGYSLVLEYFAYPEKFFFVDLNGFDGIGAHDNASERFSFALSFNADFPPENPFTKDNFRMFCAPAANIFKKDADPVSVGGLETDYRVIADAAYPSSVFTHSIISVVGIDRATGERSTYEPLYSFETDQKKQAHTFTVQYRRGAHQQRDLYLSFGGELLSNGTGGKGNEIRQENCSIEAWCTNGILPREELREGGINKPGANFPDYVTFANITRPTLPLSPPAEDDYLWTFLSHLSSTLTTLASPDAFKALLRQYDWSGSEGRGRKIEAIIDVTSKPVDYIVNGSSIRGIEFTVSLSEANFLNSGDVRLFGQILKEFLAQYVSINTFLELVFVLKPSGATIRWNSLKGTRWPI